MTHTVNFRRASRAEAAALHRLIAANLEAGHLLPRSLEDLEQHAHRFIVAEDGGEVVGCGELAPLGDSVAEIRSLVVQERYRGRHIGSDLVQQIADAATAAGFSTLCAFTHEPTPFVRLGFSIVPHVWVPEKVARDCSACALFRRCGQYAVTRALRAGVPLRPQQPAAVIYAGRAAAPRKPNVERLQLRATGHARSDRKEPIPA
jgi:amino-acid N-acetyltransferase